MDKTNELVKLINWLPTKSRIQLSSKQPFPKRREIWWVHLGQNVGAEINGKHERFERPVLVITVFNAATLFVAPITSTLDKHPYLIGFDNMGIQRSVNIFQLRTLSVKRFHRKASEVSEEEFARVVTAIREHVVPIQTESPS
jgi:mRNA interferase MazF